MLSPGWPYCFCGDYSPSMPAGLVAQWSEEDQKDQQMISIPIETYRQGCVKDVEEGLEVKLSACAASFLLHAIISLWRLQAPALLGSQPIQQRYKSVLVAICSPVLVQLWMIQVGSRALWPHQSLSPSGGQEDRVPADDQGSRRRWGQRHPQSGGSRRVWDLFPTGRCPEHLFCSNPIPSDRLGHTRVLLLPHASCASLLGFLWDSG